MTPVSQVLLNVIQAWVAIVLVLGGMVAQRLAAPSLIRLGPAKVGEHLNVVGRSEGGTP